MESYLPISFLNDFIFCPRSIYFHNLYGHYNKTLYQDAPQVAGSLAHRRVDEKAYSSQKRYLQGLEIFSEKYRLCGKIDIYDAEDAALIERKSRISTIYDGYKYQLYAQYFCMSEMGYAVKRLFLHSLETNRRFAVRLPSAAETAAFEKLLADIAAFDLAQTGFTQNPAKCRRCIYSGLCDFFHS